MNTELEKTLVKSGTSLVAIVCKDGVVMGADKRSTAGGIVFTKNAKKIIRISDYLLVSGTGLASDIDLTQKVLSAELKLKELKTKSRPTIKEAANLLAMMIYRASRSPSMIQSIVGTLAAGFDEDGKCSVYTIEDYDANFSSGMPYILGLLERQWKPTLTVKEAVELAVESLKASTQRDTGSGNGIDVFTITKEGIKQVVAQKITPSYN